MRDTWEQREMPVLDAIVQAMDKMEFPNVGQLAERCGLPPEEALKACRALDRTFINFKMFSAEGQAAECGRDAGRCRP
ncbi:MAG: hypothetical protein ACYDB7_08860 [Mycobacteriales bacterium]